MDPLAGNVAQRGVDQPLALEPGNPGEGRALDLDGEVAFAAAVVARVAAVAGAVVLDGEVGGGEGLGQKLPHFLCDRSGHAFPSTPKITMCHPMRHDRFHGRVGGARQGCERPGCVARGEFRAPGQRAGGFDGPGDYRWFCLDHVREFNAGYDWFAGMSADEILAAQHPVAGWDSETRAFRATGGVDQAPRWADFKDPLDAINQRARAFRPQHRPDGRILTPDERRALDTLGLAPDADRKALRGRYSQLVRRYHPDRNGGDRSLETKLQGVVEAYNLLRASSLFG